MRCCCLVTKSCPTLQSHGLLPARLLCPWDFWGENIGVGYHFLLQAQFCYLGRHYLRRDPQCSPYLLQVINPSFSGVKKRILPWSASQMSLNEELKSWFHGFLMTLTTYAEEILNFAWGNLWGKAEWCMLRRKCNFQWRNNAILQHTQTSRFI